jgi:integrase
MTPQRTKIEIGIYRDRYGFEVVPIAGRSKSRRFPLDTPVKVMRSWREQERRRLQQSRPRNTRGTLEQDVEKYLGLVQHLAGWVELRSVLRAWIAIYGTRPRWAIGSDEVLAARVTWLDADVAPKTINNRVHALGAMYHVLDGHRAATPCDDISNLDVDSPAPIYTGPALVNTVLANLEAQEATGRLRDSKTRARFMVRAATGVRPSELMRAVPADVDLDRAHWATRDGKGGLRPGGMPLNAEQVHAWKVFIAADAWGDFNTGSQARVLRTAGWPAGVRPYNLRHAVGMTLAEQNTDLADTSAYLGHKRQLTTRSHYVPVTHGRMRDASNRLDGRLGWKDRPVIVGENRGTERKAEKRLRKTSA